MLRDAKQQGKKKPGECCSIIGTKEISQGRDQMSEQLYRVAPGEFLCDDMVLVVIT